MAVSPSVINKIKWVLFQRLEPDPTAGVLWAKPVGDTFSFLVYDDGTWKDIGDTVGLVIPEISTSISAFTNDAGYLTAVDLSGYSTTEEMNAAIAAAIPTVFGASGNGHKSGLVPDPGITAGTTKYLREDAQWIELATTNDVNNLQPPSGELDPQTWKDEEWAAITDEYPTENSENLVESGGVYSMVKPVSDKVETMAMETSDFTPTTKKRYETGHANDITYSLSNGVLTVTTEKQLTQGHRLGVNLPTDFIEGVEYIIRCHISGQWSANNNNGSVTICLFNDLTRDVHSNVRSTWVAGEGDIEFKFTYGSGENQIKPRYIGIYALNTTKSLYYVGDTVSISNITVTSLRYNLGERVGDLERVVTTAENEQWYIRNIQSVAFTDSGSVIDAREKIEVDGEEVDNPDFGNVIATENTPLCATAFIPLMGCDKFDLTLFSAINSSAEENVGVIDVGGLVAYDANKQPVKSLMIVSGDSSTAVAKFEFEREADMEYIRFFDSSNTLKVYNGGGINLYYKAKSIRDSLMNGSNLIVHTQQYIVASKGVNVNTGAYNIKNFGHGIIKVAGYRYLKLTSRILNSTENLNAGAVAFDSSGNIIDIIYRICAASGSKYSFDILYEIPANAENVAFTFYNEHVGDTLTATLYLTNDDFRKMTFNITDNLNMNELNNGLRIWDYKTLAMRMKYKNAGLTDTSTIRLLHFSDIHSDKAAGIFIKDVLGELTGITDGIINTGDVVYTAIGEGSGATKDFNYFEMDLAEISMFVNGNHDSAKGSNSSDINTNFWTNADGVKSTVAETVAASHEFSFNKYFADYIEGWGVTMPTGYDDPDSPYYQACYWHKDYKKVNSVPGLRVIGVDCMYRFDGILAKDGNGDFIIDPNTGMLQIATNGGGMAKQTTEQETWLYNKLMETLDPNNAMYGAHVVVICHYALSKAAMRTEVDLEPFVTEQNVKSLNPDFGKNIGSGIVVNHRTNDVVNYNSSYSGAGWDDLDVRFSMLNRVLSSNSYGYTNGNVNNMGDIIQKFIDNNGKFVAWICGHHHADAIFYPEAYPDILNIVINQAGGLRAHRETRPGGTLDRIAANLYTIDTDASLIKILRVGVEQDQYGRSKKYLVYDYANRKVISEG